jgi:K+-transporting ATPase ATPase C chain
MLRELRPSILCLGVLTLITGVVYPLVVTAVAKVVFPGRAEGSQVRQGDPVVGSSLIGQSFDDPRYFWGRLSATAPPCNGAASTGSNLGPTNPALEQAVRARVAALTALAVSNGHPAAMLPIPVDLVTASASGLDPHISPAAARYQAARISALRRVRVETVLKIIETHVEERTLGLLGEPRVNVLELNLTLDRLH